MLARFPISTRAVHLFLLAWSVFFAATVSFAQTSAAEPTSVGLLDGWTIDRFHWQGKLEGADTVVVTNAYGDIRARASETDEIEVLAVLQHAEGEKALPVVKVEREAGRIQVTVEMPDAKRGIDKRRVDVSLFVPQSARYEARTRSGLIEAKKLASDIKAVTDRGEIRVSTSGTVDLESAHGPVVVTLLRSPWPTVPTVTTVTGAIELWLAQGVEAEVTAETSGLLTTDYSIDVAYDDQTAMKRATARIGAATTGIRLSSAKGDIRILRSAIRPGVATKGETASDADGRE